MKLSDFRKHGKVHATRFNSDGVALYITKCGPKGRVLVDQDGRCAETGEAAATKDECFLCILPQVATSWGFTS